MFPDESVALGKNIVGASEGWSTSFCPQTRFLAPQARHRCRLDAIMDANMITLPSMRAIGCSGLHRCGHGRYSIDGGGDVRYARSGGGAGEQQRESESRGRARPISGAQDRIERHGGVFATNFEFAS